jgi:hypothetical protein
MSYNVPRSYASLDTGAVDIPESLVSSFEKMMPPSQTTIKSVPTQSGDASAGGLQLFQIATGAGNGYLKPNSCYLRCRISVPVSGAGVWSFGGGNVVASRAGSASAVINRLQISCGGVLINSINNYNVVHDMILNHATSRDFATSDSVLYEHTGVSHQVIGAGTDAIYVSIPLLAPVFQNQQAIPLFLLNSPIVVECLYNGLGTAIFSTVATGFTISEAQLVYETLSVDSSMEMKVKSVLADGKVWRTYLDDYYALSVASSTNFNYNMGLGLSSVKAVLWTSVQNPATTSDPKAYIYNAQSNARVFLDGRQINLQTQDTMPVIYSEMQRALQNLYDYSCTSNLTFDGNTFNATGIVSTAALSDYGTSRFLGGINTNRLNDFGYAFTGQPCQNLNIIWESAAPDTVKFPGAVAYVASTMYLVVLYSQALTIDASGMIELRR